MFAEPDSTKTFQNNIKVNISMLIFSEFDLTYEHFLKSGKSIETGIGIVFPAKHYANNFFTMPYNSEIFYHYGVMVSAQYKIYNKQGRMYLSPLFKYKFLYYNNQWISRHTGEGMTYYYETLEDSRKQTISLQILWGLQSKSKFKVEFYSGVGGRCIISHFNKKDFRGTLDIHNPGVCTNIYLTPTLHMGIKMGLNHQ